MLACAATSKYPASCIFGLKLVSRKIVSSYIFVAEVHRRGGRKATADKSG